MSEWKTIEIGRSSYLRGRIGWQGLRAEEFIEEGPFLVTGTDFQNGKIDWSTCYHVGERRFREASYIHLKDGDLLITKDGTIGKIAHVDNCPEQAVLNSGVFLLRCADGSYSHRFLYHVLRSFIFEDFLRLNLAGSTITHLYQYVFERFSFVAPPLDGQQRIYRVLDLLEEQITHTEALIAKQEQVRAGLMQDLFTRGVDDTGRLRPPREEAPELYHETALGWLPKGWEVRPAERLCSAIIDCKNRTPPPAEEGYPVFRTPNVRDGCFIKEDLDWTDKKSYEEWTKRGRPRPGDILFTREAPVGEVCLVPDEYPSGCLGQRMMLYRPSPDEVSPFFFLYALQCRPVQANLKRIAGGSTVGHVRVGDVRTLSVPWCPPGEQQKIASALFLSEALRQTEQRKQEVSRNIRTALLRDLFTPPELVAAERRIAAE